MLEQQFQQVNQMYSLQLSIDNIRMNNAATWQLFQSGKTDGIFRFGAKKMHDYLIALKPDCLKILEMFYLSLPVFDAF
jgi:DNA polymerase III alpha subunit